MSLVIDPRGDPDAPFKYEFMIGLPDGTALSVMRSWLNVEVHAWGRELELNEVLQMFTANFTLHAEKVRQTLDSLERYRLLVNPHYRHRGMMKFFLEELSNIDATIPEFPGQTAMDATTWQTFTDSIQRYFIAAERQNCFAVSLVTESAFAAESYLNLILTLQRNKALQENERLFSDALRENWRDKVERLPLHCKGIRKAADMEHRAIKNAKRMFDLRNRIAHSYPDTNNLCAAQIWFDERIPLLPECDSYVLYQCGVDTLLPRREQALECPQIVDEFCAFLDELLDPELNNDLFLASRASPLGFSEKSQKYGIPFGRRIIMTRLSPDEGSEKGKA
jgi:hypothetical protein